MKVLGLFLLIIVVVVIWRRVSGGAGGSSSRTIPSDPPPPFDWSDQQVPVVGELLAEQCAAIAEGKIAAAAELAAGLMKVPRDRYLHEAKYLPVVAAKLALQWRGYPASVQRRIFDAVVAQLPERRYSRSETPKQIGAYEYALTEQDWDKLRAGDLKRGQSKEEDDRLRVGLAFVILVGCSNRYIAETVAGWVDVYKFEMRAMLLDLEEEAAQPAEEGDDTGSRPEA